MTDQDRPARSRHAASGRQRRRAPLLLGLATAVGLWLGVSAPEVSPVTPTTPAAAVQPTTDTAPQPAAVPPAGPRRGGR
jgi:hypothetical protein